MEETDIEEIVRDTVVQDSEETATNTANMEPTLPTLPMEMLNQIIIKLDPISLIALSQTSSFFRQVIVPQREDFVSRLLALELHPAHGGITPLFRARDNTLNPPFTDTAAWSQNLYACTSCMKLLPHMLFDNQSILRLGYRKPPPGSTAATQLCVWRPGDAKAQGLRRQARDRQVLDELKAVRETYHEAATDWVGNGDWVGEGNGEYEETDLKAANAELLICGDHREKRTCLECRFRRGDFSNPLRAPRCLIVNEVVPIVISREVSFSDVMDRWFPGLLPYNAEKPQKMYRTMRTQNLNAARCWLYMVRCPSCVRWQEAAAFRQVGDWRTWRCPVKGEWKCNHCVAAEHGTVELARQLLVFWELVAHGAECHIDNGADWFWITLETFKLHMNTSNEPEAARAAIKQHWAAADDQLKRQMLLLRSEPPDVLRWTTTIEVWTKRMELWRRFMEEVGDDEWIELHARAKVESMEIFMQRWKFLTEWRGTLAKEPMRLVQYALHGTAFGGEVE